MDERGAVYLDFLSAEEKIISPDEELKILEALDREFFYYAEHQKDVDQNFHPKKSGLLLPVVGCLIAIFVSLSVLVLMAFLPFFNSRQKNAVVVSKIADENSIFQTYKIEAEEEIKQKTEEAEFFQRRLQEYDSKLDYLRSMMNPHVSHNSLQAEHLLDLYEGMTSAEIENEITRIERKKENVNLQLEEKLYEIEELKIPVVADDPFQEFARYQELLKRESLVTDQIASLYTLTFSDLKLFDYEKAAENLSSLKKLINSDSNSEYTAIIRRKPIDQELISFIERYLESKSANEENSDDEYSQLLTRAQLYIQNADFLAEQGKAKDAVKFYKQGLKAIPFIERAESQIENLESESQRSEFDEKMDSAREFYGRGNLSEASAIYKDALIFLINDHDDIVKEAFQNLEDIITETSKDQNLIMISDDNAGAEPQAPPVIEIDWRVDLGYEMLGVVLAENGNQISIEPLCDLVIQPGALFSIRRYSAEEEYKILAEGIILSVSEGTVAGLIFEKHNQSEIMSAQDIVYIKQL
ncbi:MAG: hypothetical protein JEZ04_20705 [Spirochaetales bacterium]|nr:hypothetical protein [Spirochaetales bacterium]